MCTYFKRKTIVAQNLIDDFVTVTLCRHSNFPQQGFQVKKNMGVWGYFNKKRKLCMQNLTKERKQPSVVILQQAIFYNTFILCLWLRIIVSSDQGVQFMNFHLQIFFNNINHGYRAAIIEKMYPWLLPFYMAGATYCYCEKLRRTMRTVIVSYFLNSSFSCRYFIK